MKCERYKKLKQLPAGKIKAENIFSVAEFSRLKLISLSAIYSRIDHIFNKEKGWKWDDYTAYQHRNKIVIVTNQKPATNEKRKTRKNQS